MPSRARASHPFATTACWCCASPDHCQTTAPDDPFKKFFGGPDQSLTGLVTQFKKAKVDKRIKAILLDVNMSGVGWGKAEEIRDAIADFRTSGKPVYAYIEFGLNKEYYIATAARQDLSSRLRASCSSTASPPT